MKIIVGLGNPGKEYENTNHNAGYMVLDKLAGEFSAKFSKKGCDSELALWFVFSYSLPGLPSPTIIFTKHLLS